MAIIIGLVGASGSGKTTAAAYFKKQGFYSITLSDYIKKQFLKTGKERFSKKLLQHIGNQMRLRSGPQILAQLALEDIGRQKKSQVVIDGIRNPAEIAFLKTSDNFFLLGIVAKPRVRYQRIIKSKGKKWIGSYADFLTIERRENQLGNQTIGLRVKDCLKKADKIIANNDSNLNHFCDQLTLSHQGGRCR